MIRRMATRHGLALHWRVRDFVEEIDPERLQKVRLSPGMVLDFVTVHGREGLFFDFTFTKLRTILRNVELADMLVEDVNLETDPVRRSDGEVIPPLAIRYRQHAKARKAKAWSCVPIPDDLAAILRRRTEGRVPSERVFTNERGKPVSQYTLRPLAMAAWRIVEKKWKVKPSNYGISQLRGQVTTALIREIDSEATSKFAGHSTVIITETYYNYDRESIDLKRRGSLAAMQAFALPPEPH